MAVVPDAGEPLSPQAADLVRRVARVVLDEAADLLILPRRVWPTAGASVCRRQGSLSRVPAPLSRPAW